MNRQVSSRLYSLVLLAVLVGLAAVALQRLALAPLALALAATPVLALLSWRWPQLEIEFRLSSPRVVEGDTLFLVVEVSSDSPVPWVDIELDLGRGLRSTDAVVRRVVTVAASSAVRVSFPVQPTEWGVLEPGRFRLIARDRFGFFSVSTIGTIPGALRVYPSETRLRGMAKPMQTTGVLGAHLAPSRGEGCEYADVRAWQSGDRMRMVNWRVSQRRGSAWVTERHPERAADAVILLDDTASLGPVQDSTLRRAVQAAMALAEGHLGAQDRVGLVAVGAPLRWVRPRAGPRQLYAIVDVLLECRMARLNGVRRHDGLGLGGLRPGSTVVALTLLADPGIVEVLADLRRHGHHVVIVEPLAGELAGHAGAGGRGGRQVQGVDQRLAPLLWDHQRQQRRRQLQAYGVPLVRWDGRSPLGALLSRAAMGRQR